MLGTHDPFSIEALVPGFVAPRLPADFSLPAAIETADWSARHWMSEIAGALEPGSDLHKREVCRMFRETFNPYRPSVIFFAFGLFEMARRSGLFPAELVQTFEPVMQDECRHILLFANWVAWHRANLPWWRRASFELKVLAVWIVLAWERIGMARRMDGEGNETLQDNNFTLNGTKAVSNTEVNIRELMAVCLTENDRRFAGHDSRLLRPNTVPRLVRFALRFLRR